MADRKHAASRGHGDGQGPGATGDLAKRLLAAADVGITGVSIRSEKIPEHVLEKTRRILQAISDGDDPGEDSLRCLVDVVEFVHSSDEGGSFTLPVEWESAGTIAWLVVSWHVLDTLKRGGVLLIDELDASLHPSLARYVIELFGSTSLNRHGAQLVFATHDASLLGNFPTKALEPRSVWFMEKSREGHSELYSMAAFDNRNGNNNEKRYLAGNSVPSPTSTNRSSSDSWQMTVMGTAPGSRDPTSGKQTSGRRTGVQRVGLRTHHMRANSFATPGASGALPRTVAGQVACPPPGGVTASAHTELQLSDKDISIRRCILAIGQ